MSVSNGVAGNGVCRAWDRDRDQASSRAAGQAAVVAVIFAAGLVAGCQGVRPIEHQRLIEHQALIDFSGLKALDAIPSLKLSAGLPQSWKPLPPQSGTLYTHMQWRSPSTHTGVGAAYVHLPLPLSAGAVLWLAKREYAAKAEDGRIIARWKDELGREWFEAENDKYHVRGFALAHGFDAWLVYLGYRTHYPPNPAEIGLAARCVDTFVPLMGNQVIAPKKGPTTSPTTPSSSPVSTSAQAPGR